MDQVWNITLKRSSPGEKIFWNENRPVPLPTIFPLNLDFRRGFTQSRGCVCTFRRAVFPIRRDHLIYAREVNVQGDLQRASRGFNVHNNQVSLVAHLILSKILRRNKLRTLGHTCIYEWFNDIISVPRAHSVSEEWICAWCESHVWFVGEILKGLWMRHPHTVQTTVKCLQTETAGEFSEGVMRYAALRN